MDQPERINLVRIDAEVRCEAEQAEAMVGLVDAVSYEAEIGLAQIHMTATSRDAHLLRDARAALGRIEETLAAAGLANVAIVKLGVGTEELIEDNGTWRQRGKIVRDVDDQVGREARSGPPECTCSEEWNGGDPGDHLRGCAWAEWAEAREAA